MHGWGAHVIPHLAEEGICIAVEHHRHGCRHPALLLLLQLLLWLLQPPLLLLLLPLLTQMAPLLQVLLSKPQPLLLHMCFAALGTIDGPGYPVAQLHTVSTFGGAAREQGLTTGCRVHRSTGSVEAPRERCVQWYKPAPS